MKLIETKTLGAAAASIEFTSIPQDGTDLYILVSTRASGPDYGIIVNINGTTTNYSFRVLEGGGSSASSFANPSGPSRFIASHSRSDNTANTFGNAAVYIPNYSGNTAKSISTDTVTENNGTAAFQSLIAALWNDTSAITSLTFIPTVTYNFEAGSTISLYKITKGSDGIVTTS
jgi:hypothetical protein